MVAQTLGTMWGGEGGQRRQNEIRRNRTETHLQVKWLCKTEGEREKKRERERIMWDKTPEDKTEKKTVALVLALSRDDWVDFNARSLSG